MKEKKLKKFDFEKFQLAKLNNANKIYGGSNGANTNTDTKPPQKPIDPNDPNVPMDPDSDSGILCSPR
ncbi:MAG: hypothetical protein CMP76_07160 [Flavobacterium sp.]|uniref:hypothetical protein n=1 Tax=Flavobacterium sp. TaxID=239 RepID=UPI000C3DD76D|nr:hypothetical protein [Flavobacterium sp.]MBF03061.1 hypothetical protein [Flavobacterium sp.]|tara:strand:+ start:279 stop:482 length:204 start_codon:yes stop_codon:yes gene_type:complete